MTEFTKLIIAGILLLLTIISGVILTRIGRPLNTTVFSIHKISAVIALVLLGFFIRQFSQNGVPISGLILALILISGVFFLALFVSGAFLSFEREIPKFVLRIHQISPLLSLLSSSAAVILIIRHQG